MKRFLLFGGMQYYPEGGWDDLRGEFETLAEAAAAGRVLEVEFARGEKVRADWWEVVDLEEGGCVLEAYGGKESWL